MVAGSSPTPGSVAGLINSVIPSSDPYRPVISPARDGLHTGVTQNAPVSRAPPRDAVQVGRGGRPVTRGGPQRHAAWSSVRTKRMFGRLRPPAVGTFAGSAGVSAAAAAAQAVSRIAATRFHGVCRTRCGCTGWPLAVPPVDRGNVPASVGASTAGSG